MAGVNDNLIPAKKGEVRNPKGKPRGIKNWSTIVQKLLADPEFTEKALKKKPGWWDSLPNKNAAYAVTAAMAIRAMEGDGVAARWLRETGFGNKLDITTKGKPVPLLAGLADKKLEVEEDASPTEDDGAGKDQPAS